MFPSWVRTLICPKKYIFCTFVLTTARNLSLLKQFTYVNLKVLSTLIWFIGVWSTTLEILAIKITKNMLTQWNSKKSSISKPNIFETVSHSIINNAIFWNFVRRPFRCIYVDCFNRLNFPAEVSTKLQKQLF